MTETVEYAVRCADGVVLVNRFTCRRDAEKLAAGLTDVGCGPHTVVQRRRIVTDWEPVGGEQ